MTPLRLFLQILFSCSPSFAFRIFDMYGSSDHCRIDVLTAVTSTDDD